MAEKNWLALHPSLTEKRRVLGDDGLLVEFGFWPPLIEIRMRHRIKTLSGFSSKKPAGIEEEIQLDENDLSVYRDAARWSIRGWDGAPAAQVVDREIDGRKHPALSDESLDLLYRNRILFAAGQNAILFNTLSPEGKGGSGQSSGSELESQGTRAPSANPDSP